MNGGKDAEESEIKNKHETGNNTPVFYLDKEKRQSSTKRIEQLKKVK